MDEIIKGDAYGLIKTIPDKSIDLVVTDPPYDIEMVHKNKEMGFFKGRSNTVYDNLIDKGINVSIDYERMLPQLVRVMKKINIYIWCNKEQILDYMEFFIKEHKCNFDFLVWAKTNPPPFTNNGYLKDKEYCLYFREPNATFHTTYERAKTVRITEVNMSDKKKYHHPTIKPFGIISDLIENSTDEGGGCVRSVLWLWDYLRGCQKPK